MTADDSTPVLLTLDFTQTANDQIDETYRFLLQYGRDVAERWMAGLITTLERECELQAAGQVLRPLSPRYTGSQIVHVVRYTARSGAVWLVLFELVGAGDDENFDTLRVIEVESAARGGVG